MRNPISEIELQRYQKEIKPLKTAFDLLKDQVIITDEHANILYANKATEQHTGFPLKDVLGKNPADLWGGNMDKDFYKNMWHTIKNEKKPFQGEVRNKKSDKTEYWQELLISPVLDPKGNVKLFVGIEPDITTRKNQEQFREEFISVVGHQLQNPLVAIKWILELLTTRGQLSEKQREQLSQAYNQSAGLLDLISDLLLIEKLEHTKNVPVKQINLSSVAQNIISQVKKLYPSVSFSFHSEEPSFAIPASKTLTTQVLFNIISNAAKYSPRGTVQITLEQKGNYYLFSCKDNGIGIPKKEQPQVFSRFFRASNAKNIEDGTGLGLFIVKLISDSLGWDVSFKSQSQKGTTFFIKIPKK